MQAYLCDTIQPQGNSQHFTRRNIEWQERNALQKLYQNKKEIREFSRRSEGKIKI